VINLPNSLLISMAEPLKRVFNRPIFCTLQGEELFLNGLLEEYRGPAIDLIRNQVRHVDHFVAVSDYCATFMREFLGIAAERISVVPLGISMAGYERGRKARRDGELRVGYFARVAPEKGLRQLAEAYVGLRSRMGNARASLHAAGYMAPAHRGYLDEARHVLQSAGLVEEFTYHGELDRDGKLRFLAELDVLSVPATYDEPKGMFLLEAMAAGVPVVQPRRGAFTEVVERTGGGLLVTPDDPGALAEGLHAVWADEALAARLSQSAFDCVRTHYTVAASADRLLDVYGAARGTLEGARC